MFQELQNNFKKFVVFLAACFAGILLVGTIAAGDRIVGFSMPSGVLKISGESVEGVRIGNSFNIGMERQRWSNRIDEVGTVRTYEEFKNTYGLQLEGANHFLWHMFGGLLYQKGGLDQIGLCEETTVGCFHGFFIAVFSTNGVEVLPVANRICMEKPRPLAISCQHGIGHGILSFMGHDRLLEALTACDAVPSLHRFANCSVGIVMEYYLPEQKFVKAFNPDNPYGVCSWLPEKYRVSCYFFLPSWWSVVLDKNYERAGGLCNEVVDPMEQEACFRGVGHAAISRTNFSVKDTIRACQTMPTDYGELFCRQAAAEMLSVKSVYKAFAPGLCEGLTEKATLSCLGSAGVNQSHAP